MYHVINIEMVYVLRKHVCGHEVTQELPPHNASEVRELARLKYHIPTNNFLTPQIYWIQSHIRDAYQPAFKPNKTHQRLPCATQESQKAL
jgi:hypothetical protein